jgi:hypothetical protein
VNCSTGVRDDPQLPVVTAGSTDQRRIGFRSRPVAEPAALRSSATRDRSAGRARQGRCKRCSTGHLLPKPDRAGLPPATIENGARRGRCGVVRGCPLGTGRDRCEWHACGTAGEDDVRRAWQLGHYMDQRVRPDSGDACFVGKGRQPAAARQVGFEPGSCVFVPASHLTGCSTASRPDSNPVET